jgi:hypothetical protein
VEQSDADQSRLVDDMFNSVHLATGPKKIVFTD